MTRLLARPLCLAGPAALAGVLLAPGPLLWPAALGLVLAAWAALSRAVPALVALVALAAGQGAGARQEARTARALAAVRTSHWPRAPPLAAVTEMEVLRCSEDPFRGRAWLEGRRDDGLGMLCAWPGTLPPRVAAGARVRVAVVREAAPGVRRSLAAVRRKAAVRLRDSLPADVAPLATALLLGLRTGLAADDRLLFERTGTMHILAISGMHVLLLAGLVHAALRAAGLGPRAAAGITLVLALAYVPVAGGAPPIRRAVTVLVFYGLALARGRPPDVASALSGAALVLALSDPADVRRIGFWLSFAAAAGIALLAGPWRERGSRRHRLLRRFPAVRADRPVRLFLWDYVWRALPVAVAAWLATQGLVAHAFGVVTPLAPLTNLVAGPVVALLLPLVALLAIGVGWAAWPVTLVVHGLRRLLAAAATLPGAYWVVVPPPFLLVVVWGIGCLLLRRSLRAGLPLLVVAGVVTGVGAVTGASPERRAEIALLDVGHGQALLVRFADGGAVLIDGGSRTRPEVGRRVVRPALRALGVTRLEAVVCTHPDADHSNALPYLLRTLPVGRLLVGRDPTPALVQAARRAGVPLVRAAPGDLVYRDGEGDHDARLTVLAAGGGPRVSANDRSIALLFEAGGRRVLVPADREEVGLRDLLRRGVPPCDVLIAPHHGGRCALAPRLAEVVRPRWLLVSVARGFAHLETLAAYGAAEGVRTTARDGCIFVRFPAAGAVEVESFRATIRPP
ncbi:MAG: ComEC/Rec2 family competence protein [Planctomycetota bacterium]|jgi:competence protein ComEC